MPDTPVVVALFFESRRLMSVFSYTDMASFREDLEQNPLVANETVRVYTGFLSEELGEEEAG